MAEAFAKYKAFDFQNSKEWQKYYDDLLPVPQYNQVEKFKRKWYKKNIDPSFDVEYKESENASNNGAGQQQAQGPQATPYKNPKLYLIENILKGLVFPGSLFLNPWIVKIMIILASVLAVIRNKGMIKFNTQYLILAVSSEFFHNIIFTLAMPHSRNSFVFYLPIYIQFLSGLCEYISTQPNLIPSVQSNPGFKNAIAFVKANRNYLINAKNKVEIYLFFYTIFGAFFGVTSILNILLMFQFISVKDKTIASMRQAQSEFKYSIVNVAPGPLKPTAQKFVQLYEKLLNIMAPKQ
ncbi:hypothetical protein ABPG74_022410 [Tetrahymena malaccensis]